MNTERLGRQVKLVFLERSLLVNFIIPPIGHDLKVNFRKLVIVLMTAVATRSISAAVFVRPIPNLRAAYAKLSLRPNAVKT